MNFHNAFDFHNCNVLVVGASRGGIGSAIAAGFADCGATVVITGAEESPIERDRARYSYYQLDVSDLGAVQALSGKLEKVDILINCAGMARRDEEFDSETFKRILDVNLVGFLNLATSFRDQLATVKGSIIAISSMYATFGSPRVPAYGASKAGVAQLTRSLAIEYATLGIRVNAIAPGFIVTEQTARARADATHYQRVLDRTPLGRWGEPMDIVGPALFLASRAAGFVTGATLATDGGYTAV